MRLPFSPLPFLLFALALGFLFLLIQIGVLSIAFDKLGLSAQAAFSLLYLSLLGSLINVPLFTITAEAPIDPTIHRRVFRMLRLPPRKFEGKTLIAVNVGGCLIPFFLSIYLLIYHGIPFWQWVLGITVITLLSRTMSRPIPGVGIGMPILLPPVSAALLALSLDAEASAPLAYVSGTIGVILGADLLRLNDVRRLGTPFASIGGAGTFDGIFITGIIAVLLA
jgi:uncharacterized membrane protein